MSSQANRESIEVDSSDDLVPIINGGNTTFKNSSSCCSIFTPSNPFHRFFVFVFICFLSFGNYFCYDTPSSLQGVLISNMKIDDAQYGLLYSIYSWPNVVLAFCGGLAIDRFFGVRLGAIVFAFFIACGQLVVASGAFFNFFPLMIFGRFIFAIGGESLAVAQNAYIVKWFKGRELNTMFGIQLSFARIGSTINQASMLLVYKWIVDRGFFSEHKALGASLFVAFLTTVLSLLCGVVCWFFDKNRDKYLTENQKSKIENNDESETKVEDEKFKMADILRFPLSLWLICTVCVLFYAAIFPLVSFGQLFYVNKFGLGSYTASVCNGMIYLVAIPSSIFAGMLVDYFGRNVHFIILSVIMTIGGHCLLAFTFLTPFAATVVLGCAYSLLASSLWPCVAYVVPERAIATAYGVVQSIQNLGLGVLFILVGALVDSKGYLILELVFIVLLSMALAVAILLYFVDLTNGCLLTMDGHSRREKMKRN